LTPKNLGKEKPSSLRQSRSSAIDRRIARSPKVKSKGTGASRAASPATHGVFRSKASELYGKKRQAFVDLLAGYDYSLRSFATHVFGESRFKESRVKKRVLVVELLADQLSVECWTLIRSRLRDKAFLTDRRHTEEYAFDVVLGWLEEEFVIEKLGEALGADYLIKREGIDQGREFTDLQVRATADIAVARNSQVVRIDIFVDHKGTWRKNRGIDLKAGKITHFRSGQLNYVLAVDLVHRTHYLVRPRHVVGQVLRPNAAMGGTATARVRIPKEVSLDAVAKIVRKDLER
jgi:hypothetical protein